MSRDGTKRTDNAGSPHVPAPAALPIRFREDDAQAVAAREFAPLLGEPFAAAWAANDFDSGRRFDDLRGRLLQRLAASRAAASGITTSRLRRLDAVELGRGASSRTLYQAATGRLLRPGEPDRVMIIDLQAGARWTGPAADRHREWLVLRGAAHIGATSLGLRDYHRVPAGTAASDVQTTSGAQLLLRESRWPECGGEDAVTVRDAQAGWPEFAPGIRRRVLWAHEGQAALLYLAQPGASVPTHAHRHDEECLMVQGELFLDDVLLQEGDYQLAPAGTSHGITETDTGVVLFAHGDLDLAFVA